MWDICYRFSPLSLFHPVANEASLSLLPPLPYDLAHVALVNLGYAYSQSFEECLGRLVPTEQPILRPTLRVLLNLRKKNWFCAISTETRRLPTCLCVFYYTCLQAGIVSWCLHYLSGDFNKNRLITLCCGLNDPEAWKSWLVYGPLLFLFVYPVKTLVAEENQLVFEVMYSPCKSQWMNAININTIC